MQAFCQNHDVAAPKLYRNLSLTFQMPSIVLPSNDIYCCMAFLHCVH